MKTITIKYTLTLPDDATVEVTPHSSQVPIFNNPAITQTNIVLPPEMPLAENITMSGIRPRQPAPTPISKQK